MAKKHLILLPALTLLLTGACSRNEEIKPLTPSGGIEVAILCDNSKEPQVYSLPDGTRTWIDDKDWATTHWNKNEKITLWATADGSNYTLNAQSFSLVYFTPTHSTAVFSSKIAGMPAGTYTYTAVSPDPQSVSGTQVTYQIPTEQTGRYERKWDILGADPLTADALPLFEQSGQMLDTPPSHALRFHHKCHVLRIEIPAGRNIWGEPITKLVVDFPTEVAGTVSFDAADPSAAMALAGGSKSITLDLATPLTDEAENYAWIFINPTTINGDISFTAYTADGYRSHTLSVPIVNREMAPGHITPITLTVPDELPVSYVDFSVTGDSTNLGEEPYNLIVKAPEGMTFRNGATEQTFPLNASDKYTVAFYGDLYGDLLAQHPLQVSFETENALVPQNVNIASFIPEGHLPVSVEIPYFFFEDFSGITTFNAKADNGIGNPDAIDLSPYGLTGWYGARVEGSAGLAIRLRNYSNAAYYPARIDSPPLAAIKEGHSIKVKVTFNADANGRKPGNLRCRVGTSNGGTFKGNTEIPNKIETLQIAENTQASFTEIRGEYSFTIDNATNTTCMAWRYYRESYFINIDYTNLWMDNIRATIVK